MKKRIKDIELAKLRNGDFSLMIEVGGCMLEISIKKGMSEKKFGKLLSYWGDQLIKGIFIKL